MPPFNWQLINVMICLATAGISLGLAFHALRHQQVQGARWFAAMVLSAAWVAFSYAFEAAAGNDLAAYITFSKIEYLGLTFLPVAWLGFALTFSDRSVLLAWRKVIALSIIPAVTVALAWTNDWHGLIWQATQFDFSAQPPIFVAEYGLGFWVYTIYAYLLYMGGSLILIRVALRNWTLYRTQSLMILIGTSIPWIGNLSEIVDFSPVPGLYLHALYLGLCMISLAFALFRLHLLDIMPLAHDVILNNVPDGVLVVDTHNRIVMLNRTVQDYLGIRGKPPIGQRLEDVFAQFADEIAVTVGVINDSMERQLGDRIIDIRVSPVYDHRHKLRGRLFIFHDVTAQAQGDRIRREQQILADTLREIGNMLNSTLDLDRVLTLLVQSVGRVVPHDRADVMLLEADGSTAYIRQQHPLSDRPGSLKFDYHQFPVWQQAAAGEPVIVPDTRAYPGWQQIEADQPIGSYASAPIRVEGHLVGFINLIHHIPGAFTSAIADRLQIFADQAALAVQNAHLYEQVRQQAGELNRRVTSLTLIRQVYEDMGYNSQQQSLFEIALDAAMRLCLADGAYVAMLDGVTLKPAHWLGRYSQEALTHLLQQQEGIVGQVLAEKQPLWWCAEKWHSEAPQSDSMQRQPIVSALNLTQAQFALPLMLGESTRTPLLVGIIVLETKYPERFTENTFQLLELLTARLSAGLENAQLIEAVQQHATELESLYLRVSDLEKIKSDMIRIAAHDLKNPLSAMMGYLEMLKDEDPDTPLQEHEHMHDAMRASAQRMLQIITDILSLDRIEHMAQQPAQACDLTAMMHEITAEFRDQAGRKQQKFEVTLPKSACTVKGDLAQLREAAANFISNAIKYTPDGGCIRVHLEAVQGKAHLEVIDTGYGIPENQQAKMFQPFFRARMRETMDIEGTGLGLHLTKNIIERSGGRLIFRSVYKEGSTFGFELPLAEVPLLFPPEVTP